MSKTIEHSYVGPRAVGPVAMDAEDVVDYQALSQIGIHIAPQEVRSMVAAATAAMDAVNQGTITTGNIGTPIQFLQAWLPGYVKTLTAARKIDELVGITTVGEWEDEEIVQGVLENIGQALPYGDSTNVPLASWQTNFERRSVVRFEKGFQVGVLEEARAARIRANAAAEKRAGAGQALEVQRNAVGFFGFNNGANRTYGFLNDPSLPAYYTVPNGAAASPQWAQKQFLEITADIRTAVATLQTQSQDNINPETTALTLAVPTACYAYLSVTSNYGNSVREWIKETFPKMRIVSAPQLNGANGGANVFYLFAESVDDGASDNSRVFDQIVPAKMRVLGVEKRAKSYVEDFANATAGVICKRPYAVVRGSGI